MRGKQGGGRLPVPVCTEGVTAFPEKLIDLTLFPGPGKSGLIRSNELRGSIRWQTGELAKAVFEAGVSKAERVNPQSVLANMARYHRTVPWRPTGRVSGIPSANS